MTSERRRAVLLLCGDSLTERSSETALDGWGATLQDTYSRSTDVLNRGLSGYNTRWFREYALPAIREELQRSLQPSLITVWLGANDAALVDGPARHQHVPLAAYKENLSTIIKEFQRSAPQAKILVITPPVVDDDHRRRIRVKDFGADPSEPIDRTNEQTAAYAHACVETAAALEGVAVLDMHAFMMTQFPDARDRAALLDDGLHFSKQGNRVVFKAIRERVCALLPKDTFMWQMPDWKTLS